MFSLPEPWNKPFLQGAPFPFMLFIAEYNLETKILHFMCKQNYV